MQRAGGVAALAQLVLSLATLLIAFLGAGGAAPAVPSDAADASAEALRPLQTLEVIKVLLAAAGLVLVFGLADRLHLGAAEGPWSGGLAVAVGSVAAALLLASGGVGYASLTLFELLPRAEDAPGATVLPVSAVSSALNAVVSGLGTASVFATGCWAVLAGQAGWRSGRLSQPLSAVLLAWGAVGMLAFVVPGLVLPTLVLSLVAWGWLAAVLLRAPAPAG